MDKMLQLDRVQKLIKARGVKESVVQAVLNIIKLNPEVINSPDIQMTDIEQGNKTTTKQSSGKIDAPGAAEADRARIFIRGALRSHTQRANNAEEKARNQRNFWWEY